MTIRIVFLPTLLLLISACSRPDDKPAAGDKPQQPKSVAQFLGTYKGTMRISSSWARPTQNGSTDVGQSDSTVSASYIVGQIAADSFELIITGAAKGARFQYDSLRLVYCYACDPTRNLFEYSFKPDLDSLYVRSRYSGGGAGGYYNSESMEFRGKR